METEKQRNEWITQVTRREFTPHSAQNEREFEEWVDKIAEEVSQRTFRMHEPSLINIVIGQLPVALKQLVAEFSLEDRQEVECCHILALHAITCAQYVNWILAMTALAVHWIGHA
ncbi:putative transmembrane protein [Gregarina niphandrodes]|uniref:Transmembrane protein n=1 Tax=Gregarina niphandrodes TaxID=110365 RepID=A0A023B256_GRENI|nr:putative transmembrane protein [Gregarina niphandrodes]EZG50860.1 putative transmembrane protein [Gregarina niphandrodes]|eukprot:XP_011131985.1 putative transmembrane protein [Gregarina niphandrodes]